MNKDLQKMICVFVIGFIFLLSSIAFALTMSYFLLFFLIIPIVIVGEGFQLYLIILKRREIRKLNRGDNNE